ncbi:hypothetical protein WA158_003575 [Blastocystis sp. Blastoise]
MNTISSTFSTFLSGDESLISSTINHMKGKILKNDISNEEAAQFYGDYLNYCAIHDTSSVERNYKQYRAFCPNDSNEERRNQLKTIYLMSLLSENKLGQFHCEIELLNEKEMNDPYISFSLNLEHAISEGNYNKVLSSFDNIPIPSLRGFVEPLIITVRSEIDDCVHCSYRQMNINTLQHYLYFNTKDELLNYIHEKHPEWVLENDMVIFTKKQEKHATIDTKTSLNNYLYYSMETENIV